MHGIRLWIFDQWVLNGRKCYRHKGQVRHWSSGLPENLLVPLGPQHFQQSYRNLQIGQIFFSTFAFVMCLSMKEVFFLFERLGIFSFKIFPDLFSSWLDYWIRIFHKDRESAMTSYCDMNNTGETIFVLHFLHRPYILLLW